ncbi:MAG: hypothetical protein IRY92_03795 [Dactylosporangium sp.]|nr:hypothetical protein [Dactylosporangium sp.]
MASGRNAAHTAEAERSSADTARSFVDTAGTNDRHTNDRQTNDKTVADMERLGLDAPGITGDVADRPAHQWEVGDADSWEPSMTDTWNPPASGNPPASRRADPAASEATAGAPEARPAALPAERSVPPAVPPAERAVRSARQALEEALRSPEPGTETPAPKLDPTRMAASLAALAAERVRAGVPAGDGLVTGLGLARQTANGLLALGQRLFEPASRVAAGAVQNAARLPVAGLPVRAALRSGQWLARSGAQAREKLRASVGGVRRPARQTVDPNEAEPTPSSTNDSPERTSEPGAGARASGS